MKRRSAKVKPMLINQAECLCDHLIALYHQHHHGMLKREQIVRTYEKSLRRLERRLTLPRLMRK